MFKDLFIKKTFQSLLFIMALWGACNITRGYAIVVLLAIGIWAALKGRVGWLFMAMVVPAVFIMMNGYILIRGHSFARIVRIYMAVMPLIILSSQVWRSKRGMELPIKGIIAFLIIAAISSMNGWMPLISFIKLAVFGLFVLALYLTSKMFDGRYEDLLQIRAVMMAIAIIYVWGSIATLPFPSIAYYISLKDSVNMYGLEYAEDLYYASDSGGATLLSGVTVQSQFLGPMLAFVAAYVVCDMLFIEKKIKPLHLAVLVPIPVLLYMTRSRTALVAFTALVVCLLFYALPRAKMLKKTKQRIKVLAWFFILILIGFVVHAQMKEQTFSKLVRKTNDTKDSRSLVEAVTSSRRGLIEMTMRDFRMNPVFGMGFQVTEYVALLHKSGQGSLFSAPVEKGITPLMVLGETGVVGFVAFCAFIANFFIVCNRKGYVMCATMMFTFLGANMGEATFFSPGGGGGVAWIYGILGGFALDVFVMQNLRDGKKDNTNGGGR